MTKVNCLCFHRIGTFCAPLFSDMDCDTFESLIDLLYAFGGRAWSLSDAMTSADDRDEPFRVVFTFDDGWNSDYEEVLPRLLKHGWRATFFVVTGQIGRPGRMGWSELKELRDAGMEIGSHTVSHINLTAVSRRRALEELTNSKLNLEDRLQCGINSFAFPGGYCNTDALSCALSAGYQWIATSVPYLSRIGATVVGRTSVVSSRAAKKTGDLFYPGKRQMIFRLAHYYARLTLRSLVGEEVYLKIRKRLSTNSQIYN